MFYSFREHISLFFTKQNVLFLMNNLGPLREKQVDTKTFQRPVLPYPKTRCAGRPAKTSLKSGKTSLQSWSLFYSGDWSWPLTTGHYWSWSRPVLGRPVHLVLEVLSGFRAVLGRPEHTGLEAVVDQSGVDLYTLVLKVMKVLGQLYDWSWPGGCGEVLVSTWVHLYIIIGLVWQSGLYFESINLFRVP